MKVLCPTCGKEVAADDLNLDHLLAKCRACNTVFDFGHQVRLVALPEAKLKRDRGELPMPPQFKVEKSPEGLVITREWDRRTALFFLLFAGLWNGVVLLMATLLFVSLRHALGPSGGMTVGSMALRMTPFLVVGLAVAWAGLGLRFNRTTIRVGGGRLSVRHGPVPWFGNRSLDPSTLEQLSSAEYVAYFRNNLPQYRFKIQGVLKGGGRVKLLGGIEEAGQALYLENLLETQLGLADRPVQGELGIG